MLDLHAPVPDELRFIEQEVLCSFSARLAAPPGIEYGIDGGQLEDRMVEGGGQDVAGRAAAASRASTVCSSRVVFPTCRAPESMTARGAGGDVIQACSSRKATRRRLGRSAMALSCHRGLNWARTATSASLETSWPSSYRWARIGRAQPTSIQSTPAGGWLRRRRSARKPRAHERRPARAINPPRSPRCAVGARLGRAQPTSIPAAGAGG
jgi:hypothetical protein